LPTLTAKSAILLIDRAWRSPSREIGSSQPSLYIGYEPCGVASDEELAVCVDLVALQWRSWRSDLNLTNWRELVELLAIVAIVASLVFVGMELRQSRAISISEGNLANAEIQIERNNAINDHSIIWTRGNSSEPLADNEVVIFHNLVRNAAIHGFMEYARLHQLDFDEAAVSVTAQFSVFLFQNPRAREVWNQDEEYMAKHFPPPVSHARWRDDVRQNLTKLDQGASQ